MGCQTQYLHPKLIDDINSSKEIKLFINGENVNNINVYKFWPIIKPGCILSRYLDVLYLFCEFVYI